MSKHTGPDYSKAVMFRRSVLGEFLVCFLGSLWLIDNPVAEWT